MLGAVGDKILSIKPGKGRDNNAVGRRCHRNKTVKPAAAAGRHRRCPKAGRRKRGRRISTADECIIEDGGRGHGGAVVAHLDERKTRDGKIAGRGQPNRSERFAASVFNGLDVETRSRKHAREPTVFDGATVGIRADAVANRSAGGKRIFDGAQPRDGGFVAGVQGLAGERRGRAIAGAGADVESGVRADRLQERGGFAGEIIRGAVAIGARNSDGVASSDDATIGGHAISEAVDQIFYAAPDDRERSGGRERNVSTGAADSTRAAGAAVDESAAEF